MFSSQTGFSEQEWAKLDEWLDLIYDDFTDKVARGRAMTRAAVDEVARGRVWTGADAAERGLIDELGGLRRAVEIARDRANLPPDAPLLPAPALSPLRRLRRPRNSDDTAAFAQARGWSAHVGQWGEHADLAVAFGLPAAGPLTMAAAPLG